MPSKSEHRRSHFTNEAAANPVCKTDITEGTHHSINAISQSPDIPERDDLLQAVTQSGNSLIDKQNELLILLLNQYSDVFASHLEDYR